MKPWLLPYSGTGISITAYRAAIAFAIRRMTSRMNRLTTASALLPAVGQLKLDGESDVAEEVCVHGDFVAIIVLKVSFQLSQQEFVEFAVERAAILE